jgi:RNA polymerase sigma-70 factor (ECF subfamily)
METFPPLTSAPDNALVSAAVNDASEAAFRELFRRHTPRLLQFILRVTSGTDAEAEDVVQDTWMRAFPALSTFRGDSQFSTWLCAVGVRAAIDAMRHNRRRSVEFSADDEDCFGSTSSSSDERMDLEDAIARLSPGCRIVLVLHDVEGFKHEEIGQQLGIAAGTSKAQLFKARRTLRALLSGKEMIDVRQ